jgi:hypothetical protein
MAVRVGLPTVNSIMAHVVKKFRRLDGHRSLRQEVANKSRPWDLVLSTLAIPLLSVIPQAVETIFQTRTNEHRAPSMLRQ